MRMTDFQLLLEPEHKQKALNTVLAVNISCDMRPRARALSKRRFSSVKRAPKKPERPNSSSYVRILGLLNHNLHVVDNSDQHAFTTNHRHCTRAERGVWQSRERDRPLEGMVRTSLGHARVAPHQDAAGRRHIRTPGRRCSTRQSFCKVYINPLLVYPAFADAEKPLAETVKVPQMAESISEGTLKSWLKQPGDFVNADEEVATIETDKVRTICDSELDVSSCRIEGIAESS